ncbi:MAG: hypothetical protein NC115_08105 [Bacteroidales bacterium]|nr:hypothetical protein [Bacteroides sp.]MCM1199099.1 hypothetical protein [Clostridium sp.]MCM1502608.1 hypothetical protein [Bacteroidales bacterium]
MKHKFLLAAGAAIVTAAAVSVFIYVRNGNNAMDEFFNANVEALASDEGSSGSILCLQSYLTVGGRYRYQSCRDCRTFISVDDSFTLALCNR